MYIYIENAIISKRSNHMSKQYLYRVSILNKHPLEAIAYYCGETQYDLSNSREYQSTTEDKVIWNNIMLPEREEDKYIHLPEYLKLGRKKSDLVSNARNILWQKVFVREKRADAQFARLFELYIPSFLSKEVAIGVVQGFSKKLVDDGMIVDSSIHHNSTPVVNSLFEQLKIVESSKSSETATQDYTAYMMCTQRDYEDGRFVNKNRGWNSLEKMKEWRQEWAQILSEAISNANIDESQKNSWLKKISAYKRPDYSETSKISI